MIWAQASWYFGTAHTCSSRWTGPSWCRPSSCPRPYSGPSPVPSNLRCPPFPTVCWWRASSQMAPGCQYVHQFQWRLQGWKWRFIYNWFPNILFDRRYLSVAATALRAPPPLAWPSNFVITTLATSTLSIMIDLCALTPHELQVEGNCSATIHCLLISNLLLEGPGLCLTRLSNGGVHHKHHVVRAHCIAHLTKESSDNKLVPPTSHQWQKTHRQHLFKERILLFVPPRSVHNDDLKTLIPRY